MRVFLFSLLLCIGVLGIAQSAAAVDANALVTCDGVTAAGVPCDFCKFMEMVEKVVNFMVGILILISVIMLAVTGVQMAIASSDGSDSRQLLKDRMTNIVIGFFLIIASWTIIDTLLKALVSDASLRDNWRTPIAELCGSMAIPGTHEVEIETGVEPPGVNEASYAYVDQNGFITTTPAGNASAALGGLTDSEARSVLQKAGIELKSGVGLAGVRPHVLAELEKLDKACGCNILVTSVTDGKHASGKFSHSAGFKADLRTNDNPSLVKYVKSLQPAGSWSNGTPLYYDAKSCGTYAIEGNHIDVVYKTGC